jgi:hypothetical protein
MEWEETIDGYLVKFEYREPIGYYFKIYRNHDEVYDSNGLQDTNDYRQIVKDARRVINLELPDIKSELQNTMQSKFPTPPVKTYYKLGDHTRWQRCIPDEGELVVCTEAPRTPTYNRFMYAIDLRTQQRISNIDQIVPEIYIDLCLRKEQQLAEDKKSLREYLDVNLPTNQT